MKFLPVILSALFLSSVEAAPKRRLDTSKLLRSAIPVNKDGSVRKVEEQNANQILTAQHSIQFSQCLSMKVQPADEDVAFGEDYIGYTKAGQIVPQKSYVLFNICETQYCVYQGEENLYMVDVDTYMGALVEYLPKKQEEYCNACQDAQDVCLNDGADEEEAAEEGEDGEDQQEDGEEEQQEDGEDQQDEGDEEQQEEGDEDQEDGGRRLQNNYVVAVNCETCVNNGCFDNQDEDNDGQDDDMEIANWAAELAGCQQTDYMFDDNTALYAGFMCNAAGNGVEIAMFLDEDCETYTSLKSYKKLMEGSEEENYLYNSQNIVTYPFLHDISCAPYEYYYDDGEQQEDNQDENGEEQMAEACNNLLNNDDNEWIYNVADCDANGQADEQDEEEAEDNAEEDADENYQWYSYLISQDDLENDMKVCQIVQALEGEYSNQHIYNGSEEDGSGEIYNYNVKKRNGLSGGGIFGIILLVLVVVGAIVYIATSSAKKDSKKQPLVGRNNGAMA